MRYERSVGAVTTHRVASRRLTYGVIAVVAVLILATLYLVNGRARRYGSVSGSPSSLRATERAFLAANIVTENLGARPPAGVVVSKWMSVSHALIESSFNRSWVDRSGVLRPLSEAGSQKLLESESKSIASVFAGAALQQELDELGQIVARERGNRPSISAPGAARVLRWLRLDVHGSSAVVEADVSVSTPNISLTVASGRVQLKATPTSSQLDVSTTLRRVRGHWKVLSLDQAPWQEAT